MRLTERITRLEKAANHEPMLTMHVDNSPTREQAATIDHCTKTGRRLLVFYMPGDTAWMPGCGTPPWEVEHGNA
jgi:hypothetical protein